MILNISERLFTPKVCQAETYLIFNQDHLVYMYLASTDLNILPELQLHRAQKYL